MIYNIIMEKITILIFSHTEYNDLWPVIERSPFPTTCERIFAINKTDISVVIKGFTIKTYIDSISYSEKILSLLEAITTPYIWLIHDNDILQTFNEEAFTKLIEYMDIKVIDRLMFGVVSNEDAEIKDSFFNIGYVNNKNTPHFITPYDVSPSIWRVSSLKSAMESVKGVGYRDIENSSIQQFCKKHLNMWGFFTHPCKKSYYVIGRPFPELFQYLHLCVRGMLLEEDKYMDQKDNFKRLIQLYPGLVNRGVLGGQDHIRVDFRTV